MLFRELGRTGLRVSLLGMGTGGHDPLGQKTGRNESEMHRLVHRAFELGINLFDTSPGYMDSELILGRALQSLPRDQLVVSSKIPLAVEATPAQIQVMSPQQVVLSVESSLRRLRLARIDILLIAVADPGAYERVMNEHWPVLDKLKRQGKIGFLGSSELSRSDGDHQWLQKVLPTGVVDVAMVAHNMINQSAQRTVFPCCKENRIGVLNVFTVRNLFWNAARLREVIGDLEQRGLLPRPLDENAPLDWLLEDGQVSTLVDAAYRFAAYTEPVSTVMCGTLRIDELEQNVASLERGPLSADKLTRLRRMFGHIDEAIGN